MRNGQPRSIFDFCFPIILAFLLNYPICFKWLIWGDWSDHSADCLQCQRISYLYLSFLLLFGSNYRVINAIQQIYFFSSVSSEKNRKIKQHRFIARNFFQKNHSLHFFQGESLITNSSVEIHRNKKTFHLCTLTSINL